MVSDWENRDAVPVVTAAGLTKTMAPRTDDTILEYPLPVLHSDVRDFYRNVAKAIRGEGGPACHHEQVMKVMKVMEAAFRSADTNQVVTDIFDPLSLKGAARDSRRPSSQAKRPVCTAASLLPPFLSRSNRFSHRGPAFQPPGSAFTFPLARWKAVFQKTIEKGQRKGLKRPKKRGVFYFYGILKIRTISFILVNLITKQVIACPLPLESAGRATSI